MALLGEIGFPLGGTPSWSDARPEEWWNRVFRDFENGVVVAPYRRLIVALSRRWPGNQVIRDLVARHVSAGLDILVTSVDPVGSDEKRIFLCHATVDKVAVLGVYRRLHDDGLAPWLDTKDLGAGKEWALEIPRQIRSSYRFLVFLSDQTVATRGYRQKEIVRALEVAEEMAEGQAFIIPVRLDECEVPERLRRWNWVDLFHDGGYIKLLAALT
jgi:hypothetical protein